MGMNRTMIEISRPGFKTTASGVTVDGTFGLGPDAAIVHSTESGRFLTSSRQELLEFIAAARDGAFDGVLNPDVPLHPSASAAAPCLVPPAEDEVRVPRLAVAPGGNVDALEAAISLCCTAGVLTLPPGGVLLVPEAIEPDGIQRGRLVTWEATGHGDS